MNAQTYAGYAPDTAPLGGLFAEVPPVVYKTFEEHGDGVFDDDPEPEEEPEPEAPTQSVTLRPYQEECVTSVLRQFQQKVKSTLVVSATGTGKAVMLGTLAERTAAREHGVLILVHRDELIQQLAKTCRMLGLHPLIEKAEHRALYEFGVTSKVVVASVQTLRGKRLESWPQNAFKLAIVDEAHHVQKGNSYGEVLRYFGMDEGRLRVAGFTATADRLQGENIGSVFETLAFEYNIRDATRDGWLVPIEALQLKTDPPIDLRDLRVTAGDLNQGDLERIVNDNIGVLVNALKDTKALEDDDGRALRTMAFTPNIASARALALALSDVGISAISVAGTDADRAARFAAHQNGQFQVLSNCQVATEGYDDPAIEAILMCRPTKSRGLFSQMVGRGTRLYKCPDTGRIKARCRVVDFAFLTGKMQLVSPVDLYDNADTPDEVVDAARELLAEGRTKSLDEALDIAACQYEGERRARIQRRAVQVKASKFDPLLACEIYGVPQKAAYDFGEGEPASEKQVAALQKMGVDAKPEMGKALASKLLNKFFARREHGWASPWQVKDLIQSGLDPQTATGMREEAARQYLDANPVLATDKQVGLLVGKFNWSRDDARALTKKEAIAAINKASERFG